MSNGNVVDSKIVELELNNSKFESNATTSISTLDKLKKALNFSDSSKNFEDMNKSLHKIDVRSLSSGVGTLRDSLNSLKSVVVFSWIADEAIKAKNAVEGFVHDVTIGQIEAGFSKYADKTSAVQTIMAATAKDFADQGEQMEYVNGQLEKLNWFTDETSYNFLDMVGNIGKFTSNNIKLDDAVTSMQGISNWAAISGAKVGEASRAMYNLSQAISVGSVKLMDWKSIENANMATAEFKQTAIDTAVELNILTKASDGTFKTLEGHEVSVTNFNQALQDGWFTSEVLLKTLDNYGAFTNQLYDSLEKMSDDMTTSELLQYIEDFKKGALDMDEAVETTGLSAQALQTELQKLSTEEMEFGLKAFKAAQEAKTFQEAVDSVKDAVSTGWMNTFEIMFGDYLQAKTLWTDLANNLYDIFAEGGNTRNELLKEAFGTSAAINERDWKLLTESGIVSDEFIRGVRNAAVEHGVAFGQMADDWQWIDKAVKMGLVHYEDLDKAFAELGNNTEVNTTLLEQIKTAKESDEAFQSLIDTIDKYNDEDLKSITFGDHQYTEGLEELEKSLDQIIDKFGLTQDQGSEVVGVLLALRNGSEGVVDQIVNLSDAQLESIGLTEDQVEELRTLQAEGKLTKEAIMDMIHADRMTGGEMWTQALYNGMEILMNTIANVKEAFSDIFPPTSASTIYNFVKGLYEFTERLKESSEKANNFKSVLRAVFSVVDILLRGIRAVGKVAYTSFKAIIDTFGLDIGAMAGAVGDAITKFREWIIATDLFGKATSEITTSVKGAAETIKGWIDSFLALPVVSTNLGRFKIAFKSAFVQAVPYVKGLPEILGRFSSKVEELGGLRFDNILDIFGAFKDTVIDYLLNFPGFRSVSAAFKLLWSDIRNGLKDYGIDIGTVGDLLFGFANRVQDVFTTIGNASQNAYSKVKNLWAAFRESRLVKTNVARFQKAFATFGAKLMPFLDGAKARFSKFIDSVKAMDGISLDNIGAVLAKFKTDIVDYFANFDGFKGITKAASALWGDVKTALLSKGIDVDAITAPFINIASRVSDAISGFAEGVGPFMDGAKASIDDFLTKVKELDGISLDNIGEVFEAFRSTVIDYFLNFDGFNGIKDAALNLWHGLVTIFDNIGFSLQDFVEDIARFGDGIKDIFMAIFDVFTGKSGAKEAGEETESFADKIKAAFDKIEPVIPLIAKLVGAFLLFKTVRSLNSFVKSINGFISSFTNLNNAKAAEANGRKILYLAGALGVLAASMYLLSKLSWDELGRGAAAVGGLMVALVLFSFAMSKIDTSGLKDAAQSTILLSGSLLLLVLALKGLEYLDPEAIKENGKYLLAALGILVAASVILKYLGSSFGNGLSILAITGSLLLLLGLFKLLEGFEVNTMLAQLGKLGILIGSMLVIFVTLGLAANIVGGSAPVILAISASFILLAIAMKILQTIPNDKETLIKLAACLGMISVALAIVLHFAGELKGSAIAIIALGVLFGAMAVTLAIMSSIPAEQLIPAAVALGGLFAVLGWVMKQAGSVSVKSVLPNVLAMVVLMAAVGAVLWAMSELEIQNALDNAMALGIVLVALGACIYLLSNVGPGIGAGLGGLLGFLGIIALVALVLTGLAFIAGIIPDGIKEAILSGFDFLVNVSYKIGEVIGAFAAGAVAGGMSMLPQVADYIREFCDKMQGVKPFGLEGLAAFGEALVMIAAIDFAGFFGSILSFANEAINGRSNVEQFAVDLQALADGLTKWQAAMDQIDTITIPEDALSKLTDVMLLIDIEGFVGALSDLATNVVTGKTTMEAFVEDLGLLGDSLVYWQTKMEEIDAITVPTEAIDNLVTTLGDISFAGLRQAVENLIGELISDGDSPIETFSKNLDDLATGLSNWQTKMDSIGEITVDGDGIQKLVDAINKVPKESLFTAISEFFTGAPNFETFGTNIEQLGEGLNKFSTALGTGFDAEAAQGAAAMVTAVSDLGEAFDGAQITDKTGFFGGIKEGILTQLGTAIVDFGGYLKQFSEIEMDTSKLTQMASASESITHVGEVMATMTLSEGEFMDAGLVQQFSTGIDNVKAAIEKLVDLNTSGVDKLGSSIDKIGAMDIQTAAANLGKMGSQELSSQASGTMNKSGQEMGSALISGLSSQSSAMSGAVSGLVSGATSSIDTSGFGSKGVEIAQKLADGISRSASIVSDAMRQVVTSAKNQAGGHNGSFYSAGSQMGAGFANGIAGSAFRAMLAARAMAVAALEAARAALRVSSPSKEAYEIGDYFGLGFTNAIDDNVGSAYDSGYGMADAARKGLHNAARTVREILSSDFDADPVIRPVLDLSEIQNGASSIGDMLNSSPIPVTGNLAAIRGNVNSRSMASNSDVISAISQLRRTLGSQPSTQNVYNVNGITYDDGSNVSDAVRSLIRAARVERRA